MIELRDICREADELRSRRVPFLLATVVRACGSTYRRPGARMLIAEDRWITGSVSGGCLERDLLLRGAFRARSRPFVVVTYDSTSDDDIGWGLGVGCNGTIDVLLERVDESTKVDPTAFAEGCFRAEQKGALATVFDSSDPAIPIGARLAVREGELCACTVAEGTVRDALFRETIVALHDDGTRVCVVGGVTALVESFWPAPHLFVIGTQHDALALVTLARAMGFAVTVVDTSPSTSTRARFASADRLLFGSPREIARAIDRHVRPVIVLMTHDYERDRSHLEALAETRAPYLGVLGPRARTARLLADAGVTPTGETRERLHAPIGLDLGAETPREIALAILAEVQASLAGASGSRLRDKKGPIHSIDERPESDRQRVAR
jgi:xanthine/CO dehydrogenase XdhC/CoxF family maturation factor